MGGTGELFKIMITILCFMSSLRGGGGGCTINVAILLLADNEKIG